MFARFRPRFLFSLLLILPLFLLAVAQLPVTRAADHGDTPLLKAFQRHDARVADLHAFLRGANLVLVVTLDPTIPPDLTEYVFASDLQVEIFIDNDSDVSFDDPDDLDTFGGTIEDPAHVKKDIRFRVTFDDAGAPVIETSGLSADAQEDLQFFSGLRDDAFIRAPRTGRNIAGIVLEIPLEHVLDDQDTLLIWATSKVEDLPGRFQEHAGRALRSQFPENDAFNMLRPRDHFKNLGQVPDVVIFDTSQPAAFPNGRALEDDVVDLVGDPRVLANDDPFPDENDVPFLDEFPYLGLPHPPS